MTSADRDFIELLARRCEDSLSLAARAREVGLIDLACSECDYAGTYAADALALAEGRL